MVLNPAMTAIHTFGPFRLDVKAEILFRDADPVALGQRAFALLRVLVEQPGVPISKDALIEAAWSGLAVEESNLTVQMAALRRVLEEEPGGDRWIETLPRRGYRFLGPVVASDHAEVASAAIDGSKSALALPDRPSIAVLPFANMSGDTEQEYFADGITEDIITALSRYPSLFVIARNSSFSYKGRVADVDEVGRNLGVRYVLEGSLRKSGGRIRITGQLIEAFTGHHLWADRYDRDLADVFAVQSEIATAVTIAIAPAIDNAERQRAMRKPPGSLDAWAAYQRGLWHLSNSSSDDNAVAMKFFRRAIELDPNFAGGHRGLAWALVFAASTFNSRDPSETLPAAEESARRAVALDGADAEALACLSGTLLLGHGDYESARIQAERALAISPNLASAHGELGRTLIFSGRPEEGIASVRTSIRFDPRDPLMGLRLNQLAVGLYHCRNYQAVVDAAKRANREFPGFPLPYRWLAAALGQLGLVDDAKIALAKAIAVVPGSFDRWVRHRVPWHRPEDYAHMLEGLRKAGWEE
jgi:adenylate cyclase